MDRIPNRQTTWHLINIKARREQNTNHYVEAFRELQTQDPMISLPREKCESLKSIAFSNSLDDENQPKWVQMVLLSYTIIDPDKFYNRREQEDVNLDNWDSDVVANKKEAELFFIPSRHTLVVKRNSDIKLTYVVLYLSEALNRIEPETFDVNVIVERDFLDKILNAHAVFRIEANVSYSNPGHSDGFIATFDNKLKEMEPSDFTIIAKGTKDHPLINEEDGMLQSIVNMSERDGSIEATIQTTLGSNREKVNSKDHPKVLVIPQIINGISSTIYNTIKSMFSN